MKIDERSLLRTGVIGTVVTAVCCFTPVLVILFGVFGLPMLVGDLDYVLFPALAAFIAPTLYALSRQRRAANLNGDCNG